MLSVAGGLELSDVFIIDRREINSKIEVDCSHQCRVCGVDNVVLGGREGGGRGKLVLICHYLRVALVL